MHSQRRRRLRIAPECAAVVLLAVPALAAAQAQGSPFMTGATALQTNILAWLTPIAVILVMVLGAMAMANRMHLKMEGRGVRSEYAERLRAQYQERVAARAAHAPSAAAAAPQHDLDEIRRHARVAWLQLRSQAEEAIGKSATHDNEPAAHQADNDLGR